MKKEIVEKDFAYLTFKQMIDTSTLSMFTWEGLPEEINADILENILNKKGRLVLFREKGQYVIAPFEYAGMPDYYGYGKQIIATSKNGNVWQFDREVDKDRIAICWNNSKNCPDYLNTICASQLTDIHLSLKLNILYARLKPVFTAADDKGKLVLEKAVRDIINGKLESTIVSDNFVSELDEKGKAIDILQLTDINASDKIQYLIKAFEDIQRLLYTFNGQAIQGNGKKAQQTVDEVNGATSTSFIYPNNKLIHRQAFTEEAKAKFGLDISVSFSDMWKVEEVKYNLEDESEDEGEEVQPGSSEEKEEKEGTDNADD